MHPSQGRVGTGDHSVNADRNSHSRSSSATYSRGLYSEQSSSSHLQTNTNTGSWVQSAPTSGVASSNNSNKTAQASSALNTSASYMIGPTSTFYDPETIPQQQIDNHAPYQQWVSAYGGQQQQVQAQQRRMVSMYQQPQGQVYHHEPPAQLQNQYNFVQGQYTPPTSVSQYAESETGTAINTNIGGRPTTSSTMASYPQQTDNMYSEYYPNTSASTSNVNTGTPNTPDPMTSHTLSYNTTPDPVYQQQHSQRQQPQLQHQSSQSQLHIQSHSQSPTHHHSYPTAQTTTPYTSELLSVSSHTNPYSTHSSSLSPASNSWADEVYPSKSNSSTRASSVTAAATQPIVPPVSQNRTITTNTTTTKPNATSSRQKNSRPSPQSQQPQAQPRAAPQASFISTNLPKTSAKRKRVKKNNDSLPQQRLYTFPTGESDSDSEDEDSPVYVGSSVTMSGGISVGMAGFGVVSGAGRGGRLPGACTHCKKLKMKCDFPKTDNTCKRCKTGGHVCIVEGRKPRTMPNKREYLLAQIRQKDAIIESLLKQLHNPYIATPMSIASYRMATSPSDQNNRNILAWLDRLKSSVQPSIQTAGGKAGPSAFKDLRALNVADDEDSDAETESQAQRFGLVPPSEDDETAGDGEDTVQDDDKLFSLPDSHVPLGLIANLSLSNNKAKHGKKEQKDVTSEDNLDDDDVGVANETYFMPGPATDLGIRATLIEQHSPPEILVHGLVAPEDVDKLFEIFFNRVNPFISLLDPVLHTPASTFARCPFLFTVICAISSRYYTEKSEIYPIAMHFAKHSAANALIDGWKSVELCQAYILMSIYAVPARRWEEDRSWLYTGLAIRIATDLNLHQVSTTKPQTEKQEREILNRTRVWMICFNLDRSTATQFGKPSTIKEDYIMRNAENWYKKSKYNHPYDIHLCAYSALLRIVARFHDEIFSDPSAPTGLNKQVDFRSVTMNHDARLTRYHDEWSKRFSEGSDPNDPSCSFRCSLLPFLVGYSRLVMFSFGFQQAFQRGIEPSDHVYFSKCLDAAKSVLRNMIEGLAPSGYMRYAPDGHFIFASFASAFLLKLLRPEFANLLKKEQENEIFDLIGRLIQTLSSPEIAIDDRHTPRLYARFLAGLLSRHRRNGATVGRLHPPPPPPNTSSPTSLEYPQHISPSSTSAFSITQPQGGGSQGQEYSQNGYSSGNQDMTPIYREEATFAAGSGQIHFGTDMDITPFGANGVSEEDTLATMYALKNPAWWQNMMMPGFSWPEPLSPSSNGTSAGTPPAYHHQQNVPGLHSGPGFHTAQVALY